MALVGNTYLTLKDKFAQKENGHITNTIVDLLAQSNVLIEDAVVRECNEGSTHKTTVRNGLPEVEFRKFYQGVSASKGEYTQITDSTGMLETYSQVDKSLADLEGDTNQFRMNEAQAFLVAMNNTVQENIFYGSKATNPAGFDGLAVRYNKISNTKNTIGYKELISTCAITLDGSGRCFVPVKKDDICTLNYSGTMLQFYFVYAVGSESEA